MAIWVTTDLKQLALKIQKAKQQKMHILRAIPSSALKVVHPIYPTGTLWSVCG